MLLSEVRVSNKKMTRLVLAFAAMAALVAAQDPPKPADAKPADNKKVAKDQQEADLINSLPKETDPAKRLQTLDKWKQAYPETAFATEREAAYLATYQELKKPRQFQMRHVYYGPEYSDAAILRDLEVAGCTYHKLSEKDLIARTADAIADGRIVGWFQGRMEFGPRALGNRSILADPRRKDMKDILNSRIKYREPFRPFCPSILAERAGDYFETNYPSPFMVMAYKIKPQQREKIPAVTHGDGTGRLQTVERDVNERYWNLIHKFEEVTGVPVLLNTSFNENEPIVQTPAQAIDCFLRTQMDVLSIGSFLLRKDENLASSENRVAFAESQT